MHLQRLDVFKINYLHSAKWPTPWKCSQPFKTLLTFFKTYVYCLVHNISAIFPNLSQINPVDILPFCFLKLYFILIIFFCSWIYQKWSLSFKPSYHKVVRNYFLYVPHSPPISVSSMYSFGQVINCNSCYYLISLSLAPFSPSQLLISASVPFSRTPPMHAVPSSWDQDSHKHIEQKTKYYFSYFNLYVVTRQTGRNKSDPKSSKLWSTFKNQTTYIRETSKNRRT